VTRLRVLPVALVGLSLLSLGFAVSAADVTFTGSTTVLSIAEAMADKYEVEGSGGGSSVGVAALIDSTTDIADHSRPMKGKEYIKAVENEVFPFTFYVANDAIVVIVHSSNPISDPVAVFLAGGELAEFGPTKTVFEDPADPRAQDYRAGRFG